jgi:hypothetical protein
MATDIDPFLRLVMTVRLECTPFEVIGETGKGTRRVQELTGGTFEIFEQTGGTFTTPGKKGIVLGGYDWQMLHSDSLVSLDVRYKMQTDDGHPIYFSALGRRYASPDVLQQIMRGEPARRGANYYGVSTPLIETGDPDLLWMNYHAFVGNSRSEPGIHNVRIFTVDYEAGVDFVKPAVPPPTLA